MWRVTRVLAVTATALAWVIVASYALFELGVGTVTFEPESDFSAALTDARIAAWSKDLTAPLPAVCGYPGVYPDSSFELTHDDVVEVARCLRGRGYLSSERLARIEQSQFGIAVECPGESSPPGQVEIESTACLASYIGAQATGRPWLPYAIVLAGLPLVVWLVGFRLPWPRRKRPTRLSQQPGA